MRVSALDRLTLMLSAGLLPGEHPVRVYRDRGNRDGMHLDPTCPKLTSTNGSSRERTLRHLSTVREVGLSLCHVCLDGVAANVNPALTRDDRTAIAELVTLQGAARAAVKLATIGELRVALCRPLPPMTPTVAAAAAAVRAEAVAADRAVSDRSGYRDRVAEVLDDVAREMFGDVLTAQVDGEIPRGYPSWAAAALTGFTFTAETQIIARSLLSSADADAVRDAYTRGPFAAVREQMLRRMRGTLAWFAVPTVDAWAYERLLEAADRYDPRHPNLLRISPLAALVETKTTPFVDDPRYLTGSAAYTAADLAAAMEVCADDGAPLDGLLAALDAASVT